MSEIISMDRFNAYRVPTRANRVPTLRSRKLPTGGQKVILAGQTQLGQPEPHTPGRHNCHYTVRSWRSSLQVPCLRLAPIGQPSAAVRTCSLLPGSRSSRRIPLRVRRPCEHCQQTASSGRSETAGPFTCMPTRWSAICLYLGDQDAWGRYHQAVSQRLLVDEKLLDEQMNAGMTWDWGPWDPW
jgi:hypothetical protein